MIRKSIPFKALRERLYGVKPQFEGEKITWE